jgi:hypothetical protein
MELQEPASPYSFQNTKFMPFPFQANSLYSGASRQTDMRLLHHYCTSTINCFSVSENPPSFQVWQKEVPQLAFEHEFLMDNLLATASIHLQYLSPDSIDQQMTAVYLAKALHGTRKAIESLSKNNFCAVLVSSILLSSSSLAAFREVANNSLWVLDWLGIHKGVGVVLEMVSWDSVLDSCVAPIFTIGKFMRTATLIFVPMELQNMIDLIEDDEEDAIHRETLSHSLTILGKLYGGLALHGLHPTISLEIMCWPYQVQEQYIALAKKRNPRALIILAHFVVFFEFLSQFWWMNGVARQEISAISKALSPEWQHLLKVPLATIQMKDKYEIVDLLLSQLPPADLMDWSQVQPFFPTDDSGSQISRARSHAGTAATSVSISEP